MADVLALEAQAQFRQMFEAMDRGWMKRPKGHNCYECGGALWMRAELGGRVERFRCAMCGLMYVKKVG